MNSKEFKVSCNNTKVLLIGDIMLDRYVFGKVSRISPEAPVPVFLSKKKTQVLGGAGNVFNNLVSLGVYVSLITTIGKDEIGKCIKKILAKTKKSKKYINIQHKKISTAKTRYIVNGQQLIRIDEENTNIIPSSTIKFIINAFTKEIKNHNIVVLSDYGKGIFDEKLLKHVISISKKNNVPVIVDPKNKNFKLYKGATLITPNQLEASSITNFNCEKDLEVEKCGKYIVKKFGINNVLITRGEKGLTYVNKKETIHSTTKKIEVFDVSGAGDTVLSILAVCLANNINMISSLKLANVAAGIVVGKLGTSTVSKNELFLEKNISDNKIVNNVKLKRLVLNYKKKNLKIGFTNGCFDILHYGHVKYLEESKKLCDILIVALNSDKSVKKIKGNTRPINSESNRAKVLASLNSCDHIVLFDEITPIKLIEMIKPDLLSKGSDYKKKDIVGAKKVESWNGEVRIIKLVKGLSTTKIIQNIK